MGGDWIDRVPRLPYSMDRLARSPISIRIVEAVRTSTDAGGSRKRRLCFSIKFGRLYLSDLASIQSHKVQLPWAFR
jgi:hypothetical protein